MNLNRIFEAVLKQDALGDMYDDEVVNGEDEFVDDIRNAVAAAVDKWNGKISEERQKKYTAEGLRHAAYDYQVDYILNE